AKIDLPSVEATVSAASPQAFAADTAASTLFNESQSRIVISVASGNLEKTISILSATADSPGGERERGVPFHKIGTVGGDALSIQVSDQKFAWSIADLYDDWWNSI